MVFQVKSSPVTKKSEHLNEKKLRELVGDDPDAPSWWKVLLTELVEHSIYLLILLIAVLFLRNSLASGFEIIYRAVMDVFV